MGRCLNVVAEFFQHRQLLIWWTKGLGNLFSEIITSLSLFNISNFIGFGEKRFALFNLQIIELGVPTFEIILSDLAGWHIFWTIFCKNFKNVKHIKLCPASLISKIKPASQAELDMFYTFEIFAKNCSKYVTPSQIWQKFFQKWAPQIQLLPS